MRITPTDLPEVLIVEPQVFGDGRGFFYESFNARRLGQSVGPDVAFVRDTHARATQGVLRGLHYCVTPAQGTLVRASVGEIWQVAVDLRRASATFGHWVGATLSSDNRRQLWVPPGFAQGFVVLSEAAEVLAKSTAAPAPEHERRIRWDDPTLAIAWPFEGQPAVSADDAAGVDLQDAETL